MKFRIFSIVSICIFGFLGLCLIQSALLIWSSDRTRFHMNRMNLAHQSYEAHLKLSSHTYQLFKQYGDALLIGDRDRGTGEAALSALIREDIRTIRGIIASEIELVGEEEHEELQLLADIERQIAGLIEQFEMKSIAKNAGEAAPLWTDLSRILDGEIDQDFYGMMQAALEEELEEVEETRQKMNRELQRERTLGILLAITALITALLITVAYWRGIHMRLVSLMAGVARMRRGVLTQPILARGQDEIGRIGGLLDEMASDILLQRTALQNRNIDLEEAVKNRTEELERLLEEARTAEVNRRRLLSDVSHELKTPLTIIQGESEVALRGETSEEEYREALRRSRDTAAHTAALIDDLLLISRTEEGQLRLKLETTDIVGFFKDSVAMSSSDAVVRIGPSSGVVEVDRLRLRQSILALLSNARFHGGVEITASLEELPAFYRISVADNGPGLPETEREQVFQRFFRGSNASKDYVEGSGLGLPIVRTIAEAHGGAAGVESTEGEGSVFYITIPKTNGLRAVS